MSRPLLSMAMMVRDEEAFLEGALMSAKLLCDELVVVDTGSTDRTVEIARDLGARVSFFPWCDDFSAARNETLRQARGQWVAVLDADERLICPHPDALRAMLAPGPDFPFEGLSLPVLNVTLDGQTISTFQSVRIFGNDPERLAYVGRVHNQLRSLDPAHPKIQARVFLDVHVIHYGYDKRVYRDRKKAERSLPLIEASMRDSPREPRWRYYLGREYALLGRTEEAAAQYAEGLALAWTQLRNGGSADFLSELLAGGLEAAAGLGAPDAALLNLATEHLRLFGSDADVWLAVAMQLRRLKLPLDALRCIDQAQAALALPTQHATVYSSLRAQPLRLPEERGHTLVALKRYAEAYDVFHRVIAAKSNDTPGWPELLNLACGLALDLGDTARLPDLLDRLVGRHDTSLDMVWVALEHTAIDRERARALFERLRAASARVQQAPEAEVWAARLGAS